MSRFIWAPPTKLQLGEEKSRPRTAFDLLRDLGVAAAPHQIQRQAVNSWLVGHPVDDLMRTSLGRKGLPTAPLTVSPASRTHIYVMGGSSTLIADDHLWRRILDVFPRSRVPGNCSFHATGLMTEIVGSVSDLADDPFQPERMRDGTPVS